MGVGAWTCSGAAPTATCGRWATGRVPCTPGVSGLEVAGLVKRYGEVLALDGCSLEVPAGHLVGLLGRMAPTRPRSCAFVLGFAFYSTLYGSLGSLASRSEDAQAAAGPVIALAAGTYALAVMAISNPAAGWVTIVSVLPPTAPIIMPLRAALVNVPAWQNAVLHTGARLHLREAWHGEPTQPQPAQH